MTLCRFLWKNYVYGKKMAITLRFLCMHVHIKIKKKTNVIIYYV